MVTMGMYYIAYLNRVRQGLYLYTFNALINHLVLPMICSRTDMGLSLQIGLDGM